ncbi:MAG TPA: thioesterase family protein [Opitutaceae bacterium]|jgi:1,4-dihydroxy-2-naphthoyl-CoA hydrolase|nr:thioesterase family protein [Opitutaceae bacterium]
MPFSYQRTIHFSDTDAAGVVFFANFLSLCHEAYEESLAAAGIDLTTFFADHGVVVPISKSEASYLRPLRAGDKVLVTVTPESISENSYALKFEVVKLDAAKKTAARVRTEHVCISSKTRERLPLPPALAAWLKAG